MMMLSIHLPVNIIADCSFACVVDLAAPSNVGARLELVTNPTKE